MDAWQAVTFQVRSAAGADAPREEQTAGRTTSAGEPGDAWSWRKVEDRAKALVCWPSNMELIQNGDT